MRTLQGIQRGFRYQNQTNARIEDDNEEEGVWVEMGDNKEKMDKDVDEEQKEDDNEEEGVWI